MRHYLLYEDELPPKLLVIFSKEIADKIESIDSYNHLNETSLEQWRDYLEGLINWLSNPVIAWDYPNRYQHDSDGTTHIVDIGYDVTFIIKENKEGKNYIDILAMKFNLEEYGLELPPNLQENTLKNNQNKTYRKMNRIRLTESQLHSIIRRCINEAMDEISTPTIVRAHQAAKQKYQSALSNGYNHKNAEAEKRLRQMGSFNDEYNRRTKNCTQCPEDMSEEEFQTARQNNWK